MACVRVDSKFDFGKSAKILSFGIPPCTCCSLPFAIFLLPLASFDSIGLKRDSCMEEKGEKSKKRNNNEEKLIPKSLDFKDFCLGCWKAELIVIVSADSTEVRRCQAFK